MKINSELIKVLLMQKFRFKDTLLVASEVWIPGGGGCVADLLMVNPKTREGMEVEIKVSLSDLRADLKKPKHKLYNSTNRYLSITKSYYAVPTKLVEYCEAFVLENDLPDGIIEIVSDIVGEDSWDLSELNKRYFEISSVVQLVKRPKKFSKCKVNDQQYHDFLLRLSSESANQAKKHLEAKTKLKEITNDKNNVEKSKV